MQTNKILKVYIAHQGSIHKVLGKITEDTIVVVGGYETTMFENNVLKLKCDDSYCGLPDKIVNLFKFVSESSELAAYTHIYKLDEDMEFIKEIDFELTDYMGYSSPKENVYRSHHLGRCEGHYWDDKPFEQEVYDWCDGGSGYIISRRAFEIISKIDGTKYPLEDVMVASVLGKNDIHATSINIKDYHEAVEYSPRIKTFEDLKDRVWRAGGIPKWIFKTGPFTLENLPELMKHIYLDILDKNPGYELFYFSNEDCMISINHHYGEEYFRLHQTLIPTAYQADFWRYAILNQYGGCYGDFSQIPLVSYDELTEGVDRVFARDDPSSTSSLYNAVMCCKANDRVVDRALDIAANNIRNRRYGISPLDITGPVVLGQAFLQGRYNYNPSAKEIYLGVYNGSRILQLGKNSHRFVSDEHGKDVFMTKLQNHEEFVYNDKHKELHYYRAWEEKRVFKY